MTRNYERSFAERPEVYAAWVQLNGAIKLEPEFRDALVVGRPIADA